MANEEEQEQDIPAKNSSKGLIIILMVIMILLIVGIGVMAFFLLSNDNNDSEDSSSTQEQHASVEHGKNHNGKHKNFSGKYKQYDPPEHGAVPQYFAMEQFVVNFKGEGKARFLAVTLKFMTYYPQLITDMENYRPVFRNDITGLLRIQTYTEMSQDDGSDLLRKKILEKVRKILEEHGIFPDTLEDVYFERFVMQ
jgi:flagellar FliL protein